MIVTVLIYQETLLNYQEMFMQNYAIKQKFSNKIKKEHIIVHKVSFVIFIYTVYRPGHVHIR